MDKQDTSVLFESYKVGDVQIPNRFVMAALTRVRCDKKTGVPNDLHVKYYAQRASAGFILTECAPVSNQGNTFPGAGGLYTKEQIAGWKKVVDAVHAKGGRIYTQIWHGGRSANPEDTGEPNLGPSAIAIRGKYRTGKLHVVPKEMTKEDIEMVKEQFRQAALNCKEAGFDGLQLHGANGYIIDEFLRDASNQRTDEYGGSVEKRCRFPLEVIDILIEVYGAERVGIKVTPVGRFQDMYDSDPIATYSYLLQQLEKRGIAFVEIMEPGEAYAQGIHYEPGEKQIAETAKTFRPYFKGTLITNNNLTPESAAKTIREGNADLASFGRLFISNPDLVERIRNGWKLNESDVTTYYAGGEKGYADYVEYHTEKPLL